MTGQIISVWGPIGAPGRTTIAINLAGELVALGKSVILVDADTYGAAIAHYLGIVEESSGLAGLCQVADLGTLSKEEFLKRRHPSPVGSKSLSVLTGITRPERWPELGSEKIKKTLQFLRTQCDVVIVDVGFNLEAHEEISSDLFAPRRNAATLTALNYSQLIIEVVAHDALSLSRFMRAHSALEDEYSDIPTLTVLNKSQPGLLGADSGSYALRSLQRFAGIRKVIRIREDMKALSAAQKAGRALADIDNHSGIRQDFTHLAQTMSEH